MLQKLLGLGTMYLFLHHVEAKRAAEEEERERLEEGRRRWEKARQEETRRVSTPITYTSAMSRSDFESIVMREAKKIRRISDIRIVNNAVIKGRVLSQSGISEWQFELDFNDYGSITGRYWKRQDNYDSNIPRILAERIVAKLP